MPAKYSKDLQNIYAVIAQGYSHEYGLEIDKRFASRFVILLQSGDHVLDLGGGDGRYARYFIEQRLKVTLFDISKEMLAIAKQKAPQVRLVHGDMMDMEFADNTFAGVWANYSLIHLTKSEIRQVLKKIHAILKKGGVFMCKMKHGQGEKVIISTRYNKPVKRFFSFYQEAELVELIKEAGFKISKHETVKDRTIDEKRIVITATK